MTGPNPALDGIRTTTNAGTTSTPDLEALLRPPPWHTDALCRQHPHLTWFPARGDHEMLKAVRAVCAECRVRAECLLFALDVPDTLGVWAGTTTGERAVMLRHGAGDPARRDRWRALVDQRHRTRRPPATTAESPPTT